MHNLNHFEKDRGFNMKKMITAIITLIFTLIFTNPFTDVFSDEAFAQYNEPEEYIVQKMDTLWGISERKLNDTFLWPRLWNVNPHIKNPDLIYPGTKIIIPSREELLGMPPPPPPPKKMSLGILKPKRLKPLPKLVFEFPEEEVQKYIVEEGMFLRSGWIAPELPGVGKILFSEKGSVMIDKLDIIYIETTGDTEPGSRYYTIKSVKKVEHPVTEEKMGDQVAITGVIEIIGMDAGVLKAKVLANFDDILVGHSLLPYTKMLPPLITDYPRTPDIAGYIVESRVNSRLNSLGDIVFVDKGSNDGVEVRDMFNLIVEKPVRRKVGKLQIISTQPETSTAVILDTAQEILVGGKWAQK